MSKLKKIVIGLAILIIAIPATAFGYVYYKLNSMYDNTSDESILNSQDYKSDKSINNILLVGTDGRSSNDTGSRSDSMMILTIDGKNNSLKLTSLARDTYVNIPGRGNEKLTHAYAYGGINLLIETIEQNFELDIQNYVVVDFFSFMDIIDVLGGVNLDVKSSELSELKKYTIECYNLNTNSNKGKLKLIESPGIQRLNGYQALAYARIRYNDSAYDRDRRQREILESVTTSFKELPISKYPSLIETVLPYVKTNMKPSKIISLSTTVLSLDNLSITPLEFPVNGKGIILNGKGWVYQFDPDENIPILHNFIFNNIIPNENEH